MFTVVTVTEDHPQGFAGTVRHLFKKRPPKLCCRMDKVAGTSVAYLTLNGSARPPWSRVLNAVGSRPVLLSNRLTLPLGKEVRLFSGRRFPEILAMNTAISVLEHSGIAFCNLSLGIVDISATRSSLEEIAVSRLPHVKIYTGSTDRLEGFAADMMRDYGAPVLICEEVESLLDCCLILALDPLPPDELGESPPFTIHSPLLTASGHARSLSGFKPAVPPEIASFIPEDIDSLSFLSALHEQNKCNSLGNVVAETLEHNGNSLYLPEVSALIAES